MPSTVAENNDRPTKKRRSYSSLANKERPPLPLSFCGLSLPPEVVSTIGGFFCRETLNNFMLASKSTHDICSDARYVSKPWPTNRGCPLVEMLCSYDDQDLPEEPEIDDDEWWDYRDSPDYQSYIKDLRLVTPPPKEIVMIHDTLGDSYLVLRNDGIEIDHNDKIKYVKPRIMQVWSKDHGLMYEENYPYDETKPSITPPLGQYGRQFLILPPRRKEAPGVRIVEMVLPSQRKSRAKKKTKSVPLPCNHDIENIKCVEGEGKNTSCLFFMDRGESAVKCCMIELEEKEEQGDNDVEQLQLTKPEIVISDRSRTGDCNTRRSSLACFKDSKKCFVAFSYDFLDTWINIYDVKRKVSVAVPFPECAGWIRDAEFSPDGKTLIVAHCTFGEGWPPPPARCAISVYDCDVEHIECILKSAPKLFPIKESGYLSHISFSPKGTKLSFMWTSSAYSKSVMGKDRVGVIDLLPLRDLDGGCQISIEVLNESLWERFVPF